MVEQRDDKDMAVEMVLTKVLMIPMMPDVMTMTIAAISPANFSLPEPFFFMSGFRFAEAA